MYPIAFALLMHSGLAGMPKSGDSLNGVWHSTMNMRSMSSWSEIDASYAATVCNMQHNNDKVNPAN